MKINEDTQTLILEIIQKLDQVLDDDAFEQKKWKLINRMKKDLEYIIEDLE